MHYLFGYGSLINKRSRDATYSHDGAWHPVMVHGFSRSWTLEDTERKATAVAIQREQGTQTNGVLVEIDEHALPHFDQREWHYHRVEVDNDDITFMEPWSLPEGSVVYAYVYNDKFKDSGTFPITQTYLDLIIKGCLDVSEEFAKQFFETTNGWERLIVQDRESFWYPRNYSENEFTEQIDAFLARVRPELLQCRVDPQTCRAKLASS